MTQSYNAGLHRFAIFTAGWTLFLLVAGALVTSNDAGLSVPDWPLSYGSLFPPMVGGIFFEHGHRMVATLAGIFTIILTVWIARRESRRWVRYLGWSALGAVIAQGLLGGLTVRFLLPIPVSVAHACLAQAFFCAVVSLALITSRWWQSELPQIEDSRSPRLHTWALLTVGAAFLQLILGATYRHKGLDILPHIVGAAVVLFMATWTTRAIRKRFSGVPGLRRPAMALATLVGIQILLGAGAFWARVVTRSAPQPMPEMVWSTVVHLAVGALTLACAVVLTLCSYRLVPRVSALHPAASQERAAL